VILVVDTSALVEFILMRPKASVIEKHLRKAQRVIAPELIVAELTNVFWKYHRFEKLPIDAACDYLRDSLVIVDELFPLLGTQADALALSCEIGHPTYDSFFIRLAKQQKGRLLSVDAKMRRCATSAKVPVVEI
jgi:predicted nucleic acid-binding protein